MTDAISIERVTSGDGTSIGYLRQGIGPGVVLVQGAMADVHAYRCLARALSSSCTVYTAERRGRGLSPRPYAADHEIARDVEDVDAIMAATGATGVFGLSSGAVIALEAARTLERVERLAVYEPPFYANGISREGIRRLTAELDRGRLGAALVDALVTAGTAPALLSRMPRPLARALGWVVLSVQGRSRSSVSTLRDLLPGVRYDFHDVAEVDGRMSMAANITVPTLLLSGTKSPQFLRDAVHALFETMPNARRVEYAGLGHDGPWNHGAPVTVAKTLQAFFANDR